MFPMYGPWKQTPGNPKQREFYDLERTGNGLQPVLDKPSRSLTISQITRSGDMEREGNHKVIPLPDEMRLLWGHETMTEALEEGNSRAQYEPRVEMQSRGQEQIPCARCNRAFPTKHLRSRDKLCGACACAADDAKGAA